MHDIGKCTAKFQKILTKNKNDEDNLEQKSKFRHNEIGWAFLSTYLNINQEILELVLNIVYWHHGISNEMCKFYNTEIMKGIDEKDISAMMSYLEQIVSKEEINERENPIKTPCFYLDSTDSYHKNEKNTFIRTCIISADRLVSSMKHECFDEKHIIDKIQNYNLITKDIDFSNHIYSEGERFKKQKQISLTTGRTTVIKAPAGFGKTLLGLLWSFNRKRKLIWVCPRNIVAESVYKSTIDELRNFNITNISVELFLTGETVSHNNNFTNDFSSDIIITNIDNYLAPSVDNRHSDRLYTILSSDIIFDEYHELISEKALFACFLNIMMVRHRMTNSNTLLLSATPTSIHTLWENTNDKTTVLPDEHSHYPAPHIKKYKINTSNEFNIRNKSENNLVILNSISNAQSFRVKEDGVLIHSNFTEDDRKKIMSEIYSQYSKDNKIRSLCKPNVIGTHILQASLDISFCHLYESVLSPESSLQRIGRCDRWGDYEALSTINIINFQNKSEDSTREMLYSKNLSNVWFDFIKENDGKELTLDELYLLYNRFNSLKSVEIGKFVKTKKISSFEELSKIYPRKFYSNSKNNKEIMTAGSNKLRSSGNEIFIICKIHGCEDFTPPFTIQYYVQSDFQTEVSENQSRILKTMKNDIRNKNDERYDYNEMINKNRIDYSNYGRKSNTPHIIFNKVYHKIYGIIEESKLLIKSEV